MYCPKCGKNLDDVVKFCSNCGYQIASEGQKDKTKEINISIIKEVENNPNYSFNKVISATSKKNNNRNNDKNNNHIVILLCLIIVIILLLVFFCVYNKKKKEININPKEIFCREQYDPDLCEIETEEEIPNFDSLDFTKYDFSETSSKQDFYNSVVSILEEKAEEGNKYCNDENYTKASKKINTTLNSEYSYLCGLDTAYIDNLIVRLNAFYTLNNLNDKVVDAYVVGKGSLNEYANYTGETIGSNSTYIAYLRRIHMSIQMFSDYDKLSKSYERDLEAGFHPKNSTPEDIVVHETGHAIDFYITASRYGISELVIDDYSKYSQLYASWANQSYSKEVVQKAVINVNNNYTALGKSTKTELELRQEISEYAATSSGGTVMYAETFAEALVDYLSNGSNASDLSIEIYKIVQEDLKNL